MEQVIFGGCHRDLDVTVTEYNCLASGGNWTAVEDAREQLVSTGGNLKNLRVKLDGVPGTGTYVFTLRLNGAPTALTCTVTAAATTASDMVNSVAVVAGDSVCLECNPDSPDNVRNALWTLMFESTNAKESLMLGSDPGTVIPTVTYAAMMGCTEFDQVDRHKTVCPTAGKIKNLYIELSVDPGTAPDAYRFTLRKNDINQLLTVTIVANDTTGNDVANDVVVAAGNTLTLMCEGLNDPSASPQIKWGMTFEADTDGESVILGCTDNDFHDTDTRYARPVGMYTIVVAEVDRVNLGQICTLSDLYIELENDPVGGSVVFTNRVNGGDGNLTVTIATPATTGNDVAHTDVLPNDAQVSLEIDPVSLPAVGEVYWGLVALRQLVGWTGKIGGVTDPAKVMGVDAANIAEVKGVA